MLPIELGRYCCSFISENLTTPFQHFEKDWSNKNKNRFFSSLKIYVCHTCQRVVELRRCLQNFWEQKNWRDKSHVTIHQYIIALSSISHLFSVCHVKWLKMRNSIHNFTKWENNTFSLLYTLLFRICDYWCYHFHEVYMITAILDLIHFAIRSELGRTPSYQSLDKKLPICKLT